MVLERQGLGMSGVIEHKGAGPAMELESRDDIDLAGKEKDSQATVDITSNASSSPCESPAPEGQPNVESPEQKMTKSKVALLMTALCVSLPPL